ncbi:MAG: glycine cleavage system protein H [Hyphomicrobiaceae bacterium]|nr:glycine cleavage system protein H [Hyphomicrobiaceae bacterium]
MTTVSEDGAAFIVKGCRFPKHLRYDVKNHMWYEPADGGLIRLGVTAVGPALASNRIFAFTPKRVGRPLEAERSCATIESSKWVGPARIAFDGEVAAINELLIEKPGLLVTDPYGAAWMMLAKPARADVLHALVTGEAVREAYERWMADNNFPGCEPAP